MSIERFKAENTDEIVWLRFNRLKSKNLCKRLLLEKCKSENIESPNEEFIEAKAIGLSSSIQSAIGYWQTKDLSLNARILSRYYFLLQLTIAEQVANVHNQDTLQQVQRHTEKGHGLKTFMDENQLFPANFYVYAVEGGHFSSYVRSLGFDISQYCLKKRPTGPPGDGETEKLIRVADLLRRIPELRSILPEYINEPLLSFHIGFDLSRNHEENPQMTFGGQMPGKNQPQKKDASDHYSWLELYHDFTEYPVEYLSGLNLPFSEFEERPNMISGKYISCKYKHLPDDLWYKHLRTYKSSYADMSFVIPIWGKEYDSIVVNYIVLYSLSIIVRYLPDVWYNITSGSLNEYGSLVEYYVSMMDHVLPLQMLSRITGTDISVEMPGSIFG